MWSGCCLILGTRSELDGFNGCHHTPESLCKCVVKVWSFVVNVFSWRGGYINLYIFFSISFLCNILTFNVFSLCFSYFYFYELSYIFITWIFFLSIIICIWCIAVYIYYANATSVIFLLFSTANNRTMGRKKD